MGVVNTNWNPGSASTEPTPGGSAVYDENGILSSGSPSLTDDSSMSGVINKETIISNFVKDKNIIGDYIETITDESKKFILSSDFINDVDDILDIHFFVYEGEDGDVEFFKSTFIVLKNIIFLIDSTGSIKGHLEYDGSASFPIPGFNILLINKSDGGATILDPTLYDNGTTVSWRIVADHGVNNITQIKCICDEHWGSKTLTFSDYSESAIDPKIYTYTFDYDAELIYTSPVLEKNKCIEHCFFGNGNDCAKRKLIVSDWDTIEVFGTIENKGSYVTEKLYEITPIPDNEIVRIVSRSEMLQTLDENDNQICIVQYADGMLVICDISTKTVLLKKSIFEIIPKEINLEGDQYPVVDYDIIDMYLPQYFQQISKDWVTYIRCKLIFDTSDKPRSVDDRGYADYLYQLDGGLNISDSKELYMADFIQDDEPNVNMKLQAYLTNDRSINIYTRSKNYLYSEYIQHIFRTSEDEVKYLRDEVSAINKTLLYPSSATSQTLLDSIHRLDIIERDSNQTKSANLQYEYSDFLSTESFSKIFTMFSTGADVNKNEHLVVISDTGVYEYLILASTDRKVYSRNVLVNGPLRAGTENMYPLNDKFYIIPDTEAVLVYRCIRGSSGGIAVTISSNLGKIENVVDVFSSPHETKVYVLTQVYDDVKKSWDVSILIYSGASFGSVDLRKTITNTYTGTADSSKSKIRGSFNGIIYIEILGKFSIFMGSDGTPITMKSGNQGDPALVDGHDMVFGINSVAFTADGTNLYAYTQFKNSMDVNSPYYSHNDLFYSPNGERPPIIPHLKKHRFVRDPDAKENDPVHLLTDKVIYDTIDPMCDTIIGMVNDKVAGAASWYYTLWTIPDSEVPKYKYKNYIIKLDSYLNKVDTIILDDTNINLSYNKLVLIDGDLILLNNKISNPKFKQITFHELTSRELDGSIKEIKTQLQDVIDGGVSSKWHSVTTVPATSLGKIGDWALNTVTSDVYEKTELTTWVLRQNIKGVKGDTGTKGDAGPQGPAGTTGPAGAKGDTGAQGIQGTTGPKGDTGSQGPAGPTGPAGAKGDTGAQGIQGTPGVKGDTGTAGAKGATGATGPAGTTGPQGPAGPTGPAGAKGATGATGPQGPMSVMIDSDTSESWKFRIIDNQLYLESV